MKKLLRTAMFVLAILLILCVAGATRADQARTVEQQYQTKPEIQAEQAQPEPVFITESAPVGSYPTPEPAPTTAPAGERDNTRFSEEQQQRQSAYEDGPYNPGPGINSKGRDDLTEEDIEEWYGNDANFEAQVQIYLNFKIGDPEAYAIMVIYGKAFYEKDVANMPDSYVEPPYREAAIRAYLAESH